MLRTERLRDEATKVAGRASSTFFAVVGIALAFISQMQHSQVWLPLTGVWGKIILSPAHHQIHHSVATVHHDKNLGNLFAAFDWLAGTLFIPPKKRPKLVFGVDTMSKPAHDLREGLVQPFIESAKHVLPQPSSKPEHQPAS